MKKPMNFAGIVLGLTLLSAASGCARSPEASAPSAASGESNTAATAEVSGSAAPEALPAPVAPAAPAPPRPVERSLDLKKAEPASDDEPQTLEAALRALNRAKADLDRVALSEASSEKPETTSADRAAAPRPGRASAAQGAGAAAKSKGNAACENACRAFSSLTRAADAVCRLDGSSGTHCVHAKQVVADSQQRVARCACSASGE